MHLVRKCGVCLDLDSNQLGDGSPFGLFLLLNPTPDFPLCQGRQEGNRRSDLCTLRTRSREMMKGFSDFKNGCSGSHCLCQIFGGFNVNV